MERGSLSQGLCTSCRCSIHVRKHFLTSAVDAESTYTQKEARCLIREVFLGGILARLKMESIEYDLASVSVGRDI